MPDSGDEDMFEDEKEKEVEKRKKNKDDNDDCEGNGKDYVDIAKTVGLSVKSDSFGQNPNGGEMLSVQKSEQIFDKTRHHFINDSSINNTL